MSTAEKKVGRGTAPVERLFQMFCRLNHGGNLDIAELAAEFGVSSKTVRRDIDLFSSIITPKLDAAGKHIKSKFELAKGVNFDQYSIEHLQQFAELAGVEGVFPDLSAQQMRGLLKSNNVIQVKNHDFVNIVEHKAVFEKLKELIQEKQQISFFYEKKSEEGRKEYHPVLPYKLVNLRGVWYLAAVHEGKLKPFDIQGIQTPCSLGKNFEFDSAIMQRVEKASTVWFGDANLTVIVRVAVEVAPYFKRRAIFPEQEILNEKTDGGLVLRAQAVDAKQILPLVRYWMPHVEILDPPELAEELRLSLVGYLNKS